MSGPESKSGAERTVITLATIATPGGDPGDACVVVIYGAELGRRIPLRLGCIEAGRSSKCDIPIDQESVSRHHARIAWTGSGYRLQDLGSTNGTFVNDQVVQEHELVDGDQIKIGRTILKFMMGGNVEASYHEEIYRMMTFDGLTQIFNKRYFQEALEREISRARRYTRELSLIVLDIDHFKVKNDTFGHLAGDAVLHDLAALVKGRLRREDIFARIGGEEFAVLLPELRLKGAREVADKIRQVVDRTPFRFEKHTIPTTVSLGVSSWLGEDDPSDAFFQRADSALYEAKNGGRNRVV